LILSRCTWLITLCTLAILASLLAVRLWPRPPLRARIPSSVAVLDANGRLLRVTVASDGQYRLWTPLEKVSPEFLEALRLHEDQYYYWHPGINPSALVRAAVSTYTGGVRRGGSTLTMQLARLLYGLNTRSARGKLEQLALAAGLEMRYSKHDLLEAHINLIPYGANVQGVGTASLIYFGKQPRSLALNESLTLVLIPQAPTSRHPLSQQEPAPLAAARQRLFARWLALHPQAADQTEAMRVSLRYLSPRSLPFEAPHFTTAMLSESHDTPVIRTTLDIRQQRTLERVLRVYVREQQRLGIRNAAALLVDTHDLAVRASVGSADFGDDSIAGQVNGTLAKRSPGSALKPFVYALAMDQGVIHPLTVLKDAPTSFGTFSPENFDGRFLGPISATAALIRSRNVPAVALSARLNPSFYEFLREAGISQLASERHYGLALALGGGEVTMEETATLYAMLANGGLLRPLRHRQAEPLTPGTRLLSEQASFMTLDMLTQNPRPEDSAERAADRMPIAWKTGTSWGFRDAWTAGLFGHYVLIVWVGNFDSTSNPAFVGAQAAAPLFFRMTDALHALEPDMDDLAPRPPAGVARVEVCTVSGDLPNADCPQTTATWYIPGRSPIRISTIHRRIWIDARTGRQACPPYDARFVRSEVFELWPSDMLRLFAQAGMPRREPPPHADCTRDTASGIPPAISSPLRNATYTLRSTRLATESIPLAATADGGVKTLHWFIDNAYVGTSQPDVAISWVPGRSGAFLVRAIDEQGRGDSRELRVAVVQ